MRGRTLFVSAMAWVLFFSLASCGGKRTYGKPITLTERTSLTEILKDPTPWNSKIVRVEGKVDEVCPTMGCWFYIVEGSNRLMIDLEMRPDSYTIPKSSKGKYAVVEGRVKYDGTSPVRIVGIGTTLE